MSAVIPSLAMRERLGWNFRHERAAREIIAQYKLRLPRDRELIRQLALVRVQQGLEAQRKAEQEPPDPEFTRGDFFDDR